MEASQNLYRLAAYLVSSVDETGYAQASACGVAEWQRVVVVVVVAAAFFQRRRRHTCLASASYFKAEIANPFPPFPPIVSNCHIFSYNSPGRGHERVHLPEEVDLPERAPLHHDHVDPDRLRTDLAHHRRPQDAGRRLHHRRHPHHGPLPRQHRKPVQQSPHLHLQQDLLQVRNFFFEIKNFLFIWDLRRWCRIRRKVSEEKEPLTLKDDVVGEEEYMPTDQV